MSGNPQPVDANLIPRFAGIPTFMRLPYEPDPGKLDIALVGVPFDGGTTNRAGARHGPREIRNMSSLIRRVHPTSRIAPYELCRIGDHGDVPVDPIDLMGSLATITDFYGRLVAAGTVPLTAGGDHLISLPILRAIASRRPIGMIQFDSHSDTADSYFGGKKFTHGTPFRRAIEEGLLDPRRVVQVGIRGSLYSADDEDFAVDAGIRIIHIDEFFALGVDKVLAEIRRVVGESEVYLSFDIDGIDPAFAPGTGTPEIGGFSTAEAQRLIRGLRGLDLVGADVVEVSPPFDPTGMTALAGATLMFEIMCILAERVARRREVR